MTDQGFNTYFNLIDNFTAKFDAIHKRITSVTRDKYVVDFGVSNTSVKNSSDAVKKVMGDMEGLQDAFSQPLSLTVTDLISGNLAAIGRQLDIMRAKAIIPVGLSTGAAAAGLAVGAVGVAAVGLGVAATIPAAADLEASMIRVNKLIGMEGEAAKGVQKDMQDMMMATGQGLDQIAAAYETAGGAGIGGDLMAAGDFEGARKEISDFVRITLEASSAFGMTTDATSSMLSGIANVYKPIGKETNEFLRSVGSGIDAVADATIASEEKIMTAMSHASSAMAMFDQNDKTVKDTIALSAALISTNMSGDAAGEAIKDFFNYAKTDSESKISQSLGMSSKEYQAMLKSDPMAIVEAVTAKYNAMSAEEQGAYSKLFGMTGGKIPQLSGSANFQAGLQKAQDVVNPSYDAGTKMSESFGKSLAGFWTQLDKTKQTITVLAQIIGSVFLPGLVAILSVVNAILSPMAKFVLYVVELAAKIPGMKLIATAASILAIVTAVSVLASFLGPVIAGLGLASKAMMILSMYGHIAGLAISTMAGTIGTIVGILGGPLTIILVLAAAVGYLLYKTGYLQKAWDKFKSSAIGKDLIGGLVAGVAWVTDAFTTLFDWLDEQWSKGSEGAFGWLLSALDTVASTFGWLFDKLDAAYASGALGNGLKISLMGLFPIVMLVKSLLTIADYARKLLDGSNIVSDLLSAGSRAWDDISNGVQWLYDTVLGMVSWLQDSVSSIPDIPEWIKKLPGDTSDAIKDWLQDSVESIPNGIVEWLKKLWDALTSLPSSISSAVTGILPWGSGAEEEGKKSSLTEAEREDAIWKAKNARTGGGYKKFDFGMGSDIWDIALTEAETGIAQDVPNLQNRAAYDELVAYYRNELANKSSGRSGNTAPISGEIEIKTDKWGNQYRAPVPPEAPQAPETFKNQGSMYVAFGDDGLFDVMNASGMVQRGFASEAAAKEYIANQSQYAVGATFKKDGLFAGRVHAPEEIIPQATAQRGAGPIARALDTLYGVTAGGRASSSSSVQKNEVHVHNSNDFSGMRVSSDVDIEKLMKEIDRRIESRSISAVHKAMGQRRT